MADAEFARDLGDLYEAADLSQLRRRLCKSAEVRGFWGVAEYGRPQRYDQSYFDQARFAWSNIDLRTGGRAKEMLRGLHETAALQGSEEQNRRLRWRAAQKRPYLTISGAPRFPTHEGFIGLYREFGQRAVDTLVVPLPSDRLGPCCIGAVAERETDLKNVPEIVALISAYHVKSRLFAAENDNRPGALEPGSDAKVALSDNERTVLRWAAAGKTYQDIAAITGKSQRNVRYHMDKARSRYGYATTQQAIVRAAQDYGFDPLG